MPQNGYRYPYTFRQLFRTCCPFGSVLPLGIPKVAGAWAWHDSGDSWRHHLRFCSTPAVAMFGHEQCDSRWTWRHLEVLNYNEIKIFYLLLPVFPAVTLVLAGTTSRPVKVRCWRSDTCAKVAVTEPDPDTTIRIWCTKTPNTLSCLPASVC